ncbi:MAG: hypothetical protein EAX81_06825 [Candidatus Thorarchaeota archaeon]|nr:hypothetical protein [Candidatus Thorarchaeota archaeon]
MGMTSVRGGYFPTQEDSALLFRYDLGFTWFIAGGAWFSFSHDVLDLPDVFLEWLILSVLIIQISYLVWNVFLFRRYRNPTGNRTLRRCLEDAALRIDYGKRVRLWSRKTEKMIIMGNATLLFNAILLSDSAIYDMQQMPRECEAIFAEKLILMKKRNPLIRIAKSTSFFILGIASGLFIYLNEFMPDLPIAHDFRIWMLAPIVLLLIAAVIEGRDRITDIDSEVEEIYGDTLRDIKTRVFGGSDSIKEVLLFENRPIGEFQQTEFTDEVELLLRLEEKYSRCTVAELRTENEPKSLLIFCGEDYSLASVAGIVESRVRGILKEPELIALHVIYEREYYDMLHWNMKKDCGLMLPGAAWFLFSLVYSLLKGFQDDFFISFILYGIAPSMAYFVVLVAYFSRRSNKRIDAHDRDILRRYPRYIDILRFLKEGGYIHGYGRNSITARLLRMEQLGSRTERFISRFQE